jgi:putative transposase
MMGDNYTSLDLTDSKTLAEIHQQRILESIKDKRLIREGIWTESIAVGSETFLAEIISKTKKKRKRLRIASTKEGAWHLRENHSLYARTLDS